MLGYRFSLELGRWHCGNKLDLPLRIEGHIDSQSRPWGDIQTPCLVKPELILPTFDHQQTRTGMRISQHLASFVHVLSPGWGQSLIDQLRPAHFAASMSAWKDLGLSNLPCAPVLGSHLALRKSAVKTVMAVPKNSNGNGDAHGRPGAAEQRRALDELFSLTYEELRRLASSVKRGDPSCTLNPTALVNEAWLKLAKYPALGVESPLHFKRIAARAMRQLLIEAARRRNAHKRGDGEAVYVSFDDSLAKTPSTAAELLALDAALQELAHVDPRQSAIVESRFFGGLEIREIATMLDISEATVMRDWRAARAWLGPRLQRSA